MIDKLEAAGFFGEGRNLYERAVCADGFSMSVQANAYAYASPRENDVPAYEAVEVGFPSHAEPLLLEYMEPFHDDPTNNVYPYVPASVVRAVVEKHGGLVEGELPPLA
jgi:hypothetical protein